MTDETQTAQITMEPEDTTDNHIEPQHESQAPVSAITRENYCALCDRQFKNQLAFSMHRIRAHRQKKWSTNPTKAKKQLAHDYLKAHDKRAKQRQWYAENKKRIQAQRKAYKSAKRTDGQKATRRIYQAKMRARNIAAGLTSTGTPRKRPQIRGVRPLAETMEREKAAVEAPTRAVIFCPVCGTNIKNVQAAVRLGR